MPIRLFLCVTLAASLSLCSLCGCRKPWSPRPPEAVKDGKTVDAASAPFVAGKRNKVYHTRQCRYAVDLSSPVGFASVREAEASGRIACEFCNPRAAEPKAEPAAEPRPDVSADTKAEKKDETKGPTP